MSQVQIQEIERKIATLKQLYKNLPEDAHAKITANINKFEAEIEQLKTQMKPQVPPVAPKEEKTLDTVEKIAGRTRAEIEKDIQKYTKGLESDDKIVRMASKKMLSKAQEELAALKADLDAPEEKPVAKRRGRLAKPKAETPAEEKPVAKRRGRAAKPKAETSAEEKPVAKRPGRAAKPKAEVPIEKPKTIGRRGRKPVDKAEPKAIKRRGRPAAQPKEERMPAQPQNVKDSVTELISAIIEFCRVNKLPQPSITSVVQILTALDTKKTVKYAAGGGISKRGQYISKYKLASLLEDCGFEIGEDELISGVWVRNTKRRKMADGGGVGEDMDVEIVQDMAYGKGYYVIRDYATGHILHDSIEGIKNAYRIADRNDYNVVYSEGDEGDEEYAKGGGVGYKKKSPLTK